MGPCLPEAMAAVHHDDRQSCGFPFPSNSCHSLKILGMIRGSLRTNSFLLTVLELARSFSCLTEDLRSMFCDVLGSAS